MLEVGTSMPQFMLRDSQREEVTHEHFAGSIAVLAFYPMAFTGG
jgi:peroxiredoxin